MGRPWIFRVLVTLEWISHMYYASLKGPLTHAIALSASQFVRKKKSQRIYTSMHLAGLELTKLTYTRLEDNLIRHRGDRYSLYVTRTSPGADRLPAQFLRRSE